MSRKWTENSARAKCPGTWSGDKPCEYEELPELGWCFHHAPDDLLELAEHLEGKKRCVGVYNIRNADGDPDRIRCRTAALPRSDWCTKHLSIRGDVQRYVQREIDVMSEAEIAALAKRTDLPQAIYDKINGNMTPIGNPFEELLMLAAEMKAFKDRVGAKVAEMRIEEMRYEGRAGEQLRSEIVVYERAMDRLAATLVKITRLNIEERLTRITERQAEIIEAALTGALAELNLPIEKQELAREAVVRRLSAVDDAGKPVASRVIRGEVSA